MTGIQIKPHPCRLCDGEGSIWHHIGPPRTAQVQCRRCGVEGPKIKFIYTNERPHDDAEFNAVAQWNRLHYQG